MTTAYYQAYASLSKEPRLSYAQWKLYMALRDPVLCPFEARSVNLDDIARDISLPLSVVQRALRWLIGRGYIAVDSEGLGPEDARLVLPIFVDPSAPQRANARPA